MSLNLVYCMATWHMIIWINMITYPIDPKWEPVFDEKQKSDLSFPYFLAFFSINFFSFSHFHTHIVCQWMAFHFLCLIVDLCTNVSEFMCWHVCSYIQSHISNLSRLDRKNKAFLISGEWGDKKIRKQNQMGLYSLQWVSHSIWSPTITIKCKK